MHRNALRTTPSNSAPSSPSTSRLTRELLQLQGRYDALLEVKERAAARYKKDYQKWHHFKQWLFQDGQEEKDLKGDISKEQHLRNKAERIVGKRKRFAEIVGEPVLLDASTERELVDLPSEPAASAIQSDNVIGAPALSPRLPIGGVVTAPTARMKVPTDPTLVQKSDPPLVMARDEDAAAETQFWLAATPTSYFKYVSLQPSLCDDMRL